MELVARTHLKTVARLLAIPDGAGQWKFTANTIFANSTQGSSAQFFGFHIMRYSRGEERRGKSVWLRFWPQRFGLGQRSGLEVWRIGGLDGWTVGRLEAHLSTTGPGAWRDSGPRSGDARAGGTAPCTVPGGMRRPPWPSARTRSAAAYHIVAATRGSGPVFRCCPPAGEPVGVRVKIYIIMSSKYFTKSIEAIMTNGDFLP